MASLEWIVILVSISTLFCVSSSQDLSLGSRDDTHPCQVDQSLCSAGLSVCSNLHCACETDANCDVPNSECRNGKCECEKTFFELDGTCARGLNAECTFNRDCKANNTEGRRDVYPYKCKCKSDFVPNPEDVCIPKLGYHEECKYDNQCCGGLDHTFCNHTAEGSRCECKDEYYYYEKDGKCRHKQWVTEGCYYPEDCFQPNARCRAGKYGWRCSCKPGYLTIGIECVLQLGARCDDDEDCNMKNSLCRNNTCACEKNYFELDGWCVKGLNAECQNDEDCKYKNTICHEKEKTCQCKPDDVATPDGECLPKTKHHENCQLDVQCFMALPHTFCNYTERIPRCDCMDAYHFDEDKCYKKKWVKEQCTQEDVCFTKNSHCKDGQCKCLPDFPKLIDEACNSSITSGPLFSLVMLLLIGLKFLFE